MYPRKKLNNTYTNKTCTLFKRNSKKYGGEKAKWENKKIKKEQAKGEEKNII